MAVAVSVYFAKLHFPTHEEQQHQLYIIVCEQTLFKTASITPMWSVSSDTLPSHVTVVMPQDIVPADDDHTGPLLYLNSTRRSMYTTVLLRSTVLPLLFRATAASVAQLTRRRLLS
eukprot:Lankesteria_metandrocarpae@DN5345_c0_g2_i1.p1